jgi:glycerate 2-kinase
VKDNIRNVLLELGYAAIDEVRGDRLVEQALKQRTPEGEVEVAAIGKAAAAMALGAQRVLGDRIQRALVITKCGHVLPPLRPAPHIEVLEAGHPVPTEASLRAGARLLDWVRERTGDRWLLFLISGGASSLVEAPVAGVGLGDLARVNRWLLSSGLSIGEINAVRSRVSRIKGGHLLEATRGRRLAVWLISDVAGDDPAVIGSGPLYPGRNSARSAPRHPEWLRRLLENLPPAEPSAGIPIPEHRVLGNLQMACRAAAARARRRGLRVTVHPDELDGDAELTGRDLARRLTKASSGVHIWGGETTVVLPAYPGRGGRNQHLALAAALELAGREEIAVLAIGTDGSDGPTEDAGALIDGGTVARGELSGLDAGEQLKRANSAMFLEASGDLITTGPTGTNVRDVVIAWKGREPR